ncbi:MAG: Hint domain-containing protein [Rubellimicrobium sp.]|nr:Hint domain-containing protein [Rubellimicrobium sp.]
MTTLHSGRDTGQDSGPVWLGLRDRDGTAGGALALTAAAGPMPQGALLAELAVPGGRGRQNLLRYGSRDPEPAYLALTFEPGFGIALRQGRGTESRQIILPVPDLSEGECVTLGLAWDLAAGAALLWAHLPDRPALFVAGSTRPLGPHFADARRILSDPLAAVMDRHLHFVAIADRPVPVGPVAGLGCGAPVAVPGGTLPAAHLAAGDAVLLAGGGLGRIAWAGTIALPARGRFRPYLLRAPYGGVTADFIAAPDLRLRLRGAEVDYLFATDAVSATVRQLADLRRVVTLPPRPVVRYRQFILDRPGAMIAGGVEIEPWSAAALGTRDPALLALSAPGPAAGATIARPGANPAGNPGTDPGTDPGWARPLLDYEAMTLRRMRAA